MAAAEDPFVFASKLLDLLRFGGFTATYKYAVLLGLMDLCVEFNARGGAPTTITTPQLAEKVIEIYWPQTWPFERGILRQSTSGGQAKIVTQICEWRRQHAPAGQSLARARIEQPAAFATLVRRVEWTLVQMPLPKLQRVGQGVDNFIYSIAWSDDVKKSEFNSASFDNRLLLEPDAAAQLIRVAPLLRPLIHREWTAMVADINALPIQRLESFLFEADDQIDLGPVRDLLLELQDNRCFYCGAKIKVDAQVDHFIARARHPDHGIDNLVAAHQACNGSKSDFLAHTEHLLAWARRFERSSADLEAMARRAAWERRPVRTANIVRTIYGQLDHGAVLWRRVGRTKVSWEIMNAGERRSAFGLLLTASQPSGRR
jgi:hypothetical protein